MKELSTEKKNKSMCQSEREKATRPIASSCSFCFCFLIKLISASKRQRKSSTNDDDQILTVPVRVVLLSFKITSSFLFDRSNLRTQFDKQQNEDFSNCFSSLFVFLLFCVKISVIKQNLFFSLLFLYCLVQSLR